MHVCRWRSLCVKGVWVDDDDGLMQQSMNMHEWSSGSVYEWMNGEGVWSALVGRVVSTAYSFASPLPSTRLRSAYTDLETRPSWSRCTSRSWSVQSTVYRSSVCFSCLNVAHVRNSCITNAYIRLTYAFNDNDFNVLCCSYEIITYLRSYYTNKLYLNATWRTLSGI